MFKLFSKGNQVVQDPFRFQGHSNFAISKCHNNFVRESIV